MRKCLHPPSQDLEGLARGRGHRASRGRLLEWEIARGAASGDRASVGPEDVKCDVEAGDASQETSGPGPGGPLDLGVAGGGLASAVLSSSPASSAAAVAGATASAAVA